MLQRFCLFAFVSLFIACASASAAAPLVAPTDALTPQEQLKKFKLPPGFEIQLVASEPDINKPMNINFDSRGRMWVSSSIEYPWPVPAGKKGRDRITVFTDINKDGRAGSRHFFADDLNIPIGVLPLKGGKEAILWSVPNIWKFTDTDDDGVADKREVLFGPFDYADTHGNQNGFRYHIDGWIYANHGFRNNSVNVKAKGEGPVVIAMNSGNTYRFKPDGSKIELWSAGQVNPFGLTFDPWGNLFAADCHSKPCTMVIRGAFYESFGKPHDGLGYGPNMTNNDHGSSGIGGIAYYTAEHFPKEYRDCLYLGNVVTGIVQRDVIKWNGSTPWVDKPADFITCDDLWFRPVDIQMGPDGALYIADFYNCIIGHYEVDLKHPRRDRERGRIWRVVYKGTDGKAEPPKAVADLTKCREEEFVEALNSKNLTRRSLAFNALTDGSHEWIRAGDVKMKVDLPLLHALAERVPNMKVVFGPSEDGGETVPSDTMLDVSLARLIAERSQVAAAEREKLHGLLQSNTAMVVRFAADAAGRHPDPANIKPLLDAWAKAHEHDTALIHTIRIALRNQLRATENIDKLADIKLAPAELGRLVNIALAVPTDAAAWFAFDYVLRNDVSSDVMSRVMLHVAKNIGDGRISDVIHFVREKFDGDIDQQLALFQSIHAGMKQRGTVIAPGSDMKKWAFALAGDLLDPAKNPAPMWTSFALDPAKPTKNPFGLRERTCDDGQKTLFIDSIVNGEQLTGIFRSQPFAIPAKLSFHICGHNGMPGTHTPQTNVIRLKLVDGGEVVAQQPTPRDDTAKKHAWDLAKWVGKQGVIEIVDTDTRDAYAWIGVSRFEPAVVRVPSGLGNTNDRQSIAISIAGDLQLTGLADQVFGVLTSASAAPETRIAAAGAAQQLDRDRATKPLAAVARGASEPTALRVKATQLLASVNTSESREAIAAALSTAPAAVQQPIALALAANADGANALLDLVAAGKASPRLLQDKQVRTRIDQSKPKDAAQRIADLTKNLPAAEDRINKLIADRSSRFAASQPDAKAFERGLAVFKTNCAACHRVTLPGAGAEGIVGNLVGPQLNGIGVRGHERLLEDILDSNRNVDAAFKSFIFTMKDGELITGMKLREEGKVIVLADAAGKEVKLNSADIAETRPSALSPMPSNFADVIAEKDLFDLLAFLLSQKQAAEK